MTAVWQGFEAGFGGEVFRGIGRRPAGQAVIVLPGGLEHHQVGRFQLHPAFRERMLDGLILSDRTAEHDALFGVSGGAGERGAAQPDRLGGQPGCAPD